MRSPDQLLYDSEASLRLVDHAIEELNESGAELDNDARGFLEHVMAQPGGFAELSRTLLRAYAETVGIVQRLRESCGMVDSEGADRLQQMHARVREVSTATENATTGILDSVTRSLALADRLPVGTPRGAPAPRPPPRSPARAPPRRPQAAHRPAQGRAAQRPEPSPVPGHHRAAARPHRRAPRRHAQADLTDRHDVRAPRGELRQGRHERLRSECVRGCRRRRGRPGRRRRNLRCSGRTQNRLTGDGAHCDVAPRRPRQPTRAP